MFESTNRNLNLSRNNGNPQEGIILNNFRMEASGARSRRSTSIVHGLTSTETVQIYPNPVSDVLNINFQKTLQQGKVKIYDMRGNLVIRQKINKTINVSNLPNGFYMLNIEDKHKQTLFTKIFIKNK